jgi:anti-sigma regulatory factor (Ser/Thr protein kinase)
MAEQRSFKFRSRPEAVSAARRALDGFDSLIGAAVFYDASLCVSELVTNAVLHAEIGPDDELCLDVRIDDDRLRVTVVDSGHGFEPAQPSAGDASGWGLFIVDRLSHRWGVEREPDATRVWFEMDARESRREPADAGGAALPASTEQASEPAREQGRSGGPTAHLRLTTQP